MTASPNDPCLLRFGATFDQQVLIIPPLFEELNRTRRMIVEMMRGLNSAKVGSVLIDLPGTGESLLPSSTITFSLWRAAVQSCAEAIKPTVIASFRGGALIDEARAAKGWWRFSPETGLRLVRDLERARLASADGNALYAGHALSASFVEELREAAPQMRTPVRTLRLDSDANEADATISGSPLWRRAEPGEDAAMTALLVSDLAQWVAQCAAS